MGAVWELPAKKIAGNSQMAPTFLFRIFRIFYSNYFIKNPQTTIALTFLTHIISAIGGVKPKIMLYGVIKQRMTLLQC